MFRKPLLVLSLLGLLFFSDLLVHPDQVLYSDYSDMVSLHLPSRIFLARSFQETGELPLWCPNNLGGMPFIHDVQSSAFYPPHWLLLCLPPAQQGAGLSWLIVFHVILAGCCMYAYAAHRGLGSFAAFIAALGYMFAGKWLLHVLAGGHYNMVPLAWLPLVLLSLERAVYESSIRHAAWAAVAFALIVLGAYPYVTLYTGMFVALWTLGACWEAGNPWRITRHRLVRCLSFGLFTAALAILLSAVQLLPSMEAAGLASRSLGVPASSETLSGAVWSLTGLVGTSIVANPDALWENRTAFGIVWIGLAAIGACLSRAHARLPALAIVGLLIFACGGAALVQGLPGFRLFQLPSRALLLAAFPVSLLAGLAMDRLQQASASERGQSLVSFAKTAAVALCLVAGSAVVLRSRGEALQLRPYWFTLLFTVPASSWLLRRRYLRQSTFAVGWTVVLLVDLWGVALPLVSVRTQAELFGAVSPRDPDSYGRILDVPPPGQSANSTPLWPGLAMVLGQEPVRGFNPVDVLRYKQYLQFIADRDEPLRPLDRMYTSAVLGTFPIRNQALANLLGVGTLLQPTDVPLECTVPDPVARRDWKLVSTDEAPTTFNFVPATPDGSDCGLHALPPYSLYRNDAVMDRAFIVPTARAWPEGVSPLVALKSTDLRSCALLEDFDEPERKDRPSALSTSATTTKRTPNGVVIRTDGSGGYLVLTDVWFPGWRCTVDDQEVPIYRADFLFRAVKVPQGKHWVVFRFDPPSYRVGKTLSLFGCVLVVCLVLGRVLPRRRGANLAAPHFERLPVSV